MTDNKISEIAHKIRCAFCLNSNATNANETQNGTAYLCDDCHKAGYKAKFYHIFHGDNVREVPIDEPKPVLPPSNIDTEIKDAEEQKAPLSDETAKQIAKAIEEDKVRTE